MKIVNKTELTKKLLSVFLLISMIVFFTSCESISDKIPSEIFKTSSEMDKYFVPVKVERVVDGDTIKAKIKGKSSTVRMIGVDTPETVHPNKPVEYYGKEASDFTKKSLNGKTVYLQKDVSETDRYGRYLAYVWLEQPSRIEPGKEEVKSKMFNAILISKGYGQVVTFPPDVKYTDWFRDFQQKPREKGIGMWKASESNTADKKPDVSKNNGKKVKSSKNGNKIKGNINSKGEKIYHVPGSRYYNQVKPEALFETEEEAIAAGFRAPK